MIYLVTFGIFLVFVFCMAISLIFRNQSLKSESEAHALLELEGISCAACSNSSCGFHGQERKPTKKCLHETEIPHENV